jgi:hypothetical protein
MPQGPIAVANINIAAQGAKPSLSITTQMVVKAARGTLLGIVVLVPGTAPGGAYDSATAAGAVAGQQITPIPNAEGAVSLPAAGFPFLNGLVVTPGAGQTISVSFI